MPTHMDVHPFATQEIEKKKKGPGMPTKYNPVSIQKLEQAWMFGSTDAEAMIAAGISKRTLKNWMDAHPDLRERRDMLKDWPVIMARRNINIVLARPADHGLSHESIELSKWYLQKKRRDEFGDDKSQQSDNSGIIGAFDAILKQKVEVKSSTYYLKKPEPITDGEESGDNTGGSVQESEG